MTAFLHQTIVSSSALVVMQFQKSHSGVNKKPDGNRPDSNKPSVMDMLEGRPQPKIFEAVTVTDPQ